TTAATENARAVDSAAANLGLVARTAESHATAAMQVSASTEEQSAACEQMSMASTQLFHGSHALKDLVGELKTDGVLPTTEMQVPAQNKPHPRLTPPNPQPPLVKKGRVSDLFFSPFRAVWLRVHRAVGRPGSPLRRNARSGGAANYTRSLCSLVRLLGRSL